VIVDQFVDRTFAGKKAFSHRARGACVDGASGLRAAWRSRRAGGARGRHRRCPGGTYLVMEGPQFSGLAESELYRTWNCDVVGMTNMPEAKLAREAELCYATVAMVTDYDCWHPNHDDVTVDAIIKVLLANADKARALIKCLAPRLRGDAAARQCGCRTALEHALITAHEARDPEMVAKLDAVAGRLLKNP